MKNKTKLKAQLIAALMTSILSSTLAQAADSDDSVWDYESIVDQLSQTRAQTEYQSTDPFADVVIHGGVSFVTSFISMSPVEGVTPRGFLNGIEASLGIDLFSPRWVAEGAVRSFGTTEFETSEVSLKEFDLRIVHRPFLGRNLRLRVGGGLAARYLESTHLAGASRSTQKFTTPSSILLFGLDLHITKAFSVGSEFAWRSALIEETDDGTAFDAGLKINGHF